MATLSQSPQHVAARACAYAAFALGLLAAGLSCSRPSVVLPDTLGGIPRAQLLEGDEAKAVVDRLHGRGVTPVRNVVATYEGERGEATLYFSEYASAAEAADVGARMASKIRTGEFPFTSPSEIERGGRRVQVCYGLGQQHYFFAAGRGLFWLAVDPQVSSQCLEDLLAAEMSGAPPPGGR